MCVLRWRDLLFVLLFTTTAISCGEVDNDDPTRDLRVVTQADALRAKLGESTKGSFTLVNPSPDTMQFTIKSHAPESLLVPAVKQGTIEPKSAQKILVTATCPMQDGQFLMKLTATNDVPDSKPVDIFLRLQCGWVAADPATIGTLLVIVEGLPENINANIKVEGPDEFMAIIDTTTTLPGLSLGHYVLTADPIIVDNKTYVPGPLIFSLVVTNDNKARAEFNYIIEREDPDD